MVYFTKRCLKKIKIKNHRKFVPKNYPEFSTAIAGCHAVMWAPCLETCRPWHTRMQHKRGLAFCPKIAPRHGSMECTSTSCCRLVLYHHQQPATYRVTACREFNDWSHELTSLVVHSCKKKLLFF